MKIEKRLERIEGRLNRFEISLNSMKKLRDRIKSIADSQKYYLKKRLPKEGQKAKRKYLAKMERVLKTIDRFLEATQGVNFRSSIGRKEQGGARSCLFMCTTNEAKKLRRLLNQDMRIGHLWKEVNKDAKAPGRASKTKTNGKGPECPI